MSNYLATIKNLSVKLNTLQPLKREDEDRLWKKFRLEWNYNSNHIEGNTLTYGETKLLLIFDKTTGEHELREYEEMKAHDVALQLVVDLASDKERDLSESFIRQLNKTILVRQFWKEAITPDGQPTRREIKIGEYKSFPNSVRLSNGEIFHYASPEETPALMNELMNWYSSAIDTTDPVDLAAEFHHKFVCIHPFDDGNGRIARLLMNYILLKNGLPPVIIKSSDKKNYLLALNKADVGDLNAFNEYIAKQLVWSLEISIKAANGENIEEDDDIDKEIAVLKKSLKQEDDIKEKKSAANIEEVLLQSFFPLARRIQSKIAEFDDLFYEVHHTYYINDFGLPNSGNYLPELEYKAIVFNILYPNEYSLLKESEGVKILQQEILGRDNGLINFYKINFSWKGFKKDKFNTFSIDKRLFFRFSDFYYTIEIENKNKFRIEKLYTENLSESEIKNIANELCRIILEEIKQHVKK